MDEDIATLKCGAIIQQALVGESEASRGFRNGFEV